MNGKVAGVKTAAQPSLTGRWIGFSKDTGHILLQVVQDGEDISGAAGLFARTVALVGRVYGPTILLSFTLENTFLEFRGRYDPPPDRFSGTLLLDGMDIKEISILFKRQ